MSDEYTSIKERRDELESLADSELPCSEIADALLEIAGEAE